MIKMYWILLQKPIAPHHHHHHHLIALVRIAPVNYAESKSCCFYIESSVLNWHTHTQILGPRCFHPKIPQRRFVKTARTRCSRLHRMTCSKQAPRYASWLTYSSTRETTIRAKRPSSLASSRRCWTWWSSRSRSTGFASVATTDPCPACCGRNRWSDWNTTATAPSCWSRSSVGPWVWILPRQTVWYWWTFGGIQRWRSKRLTECIELGKDYPCM